MKSSYTVHEFVSKKEIVLIWNIIIFSAEMACLGWADFFSLTFELHPFTRFKLSQSCLLDSRHLSCIYYSVISTKHFGPKNIISFHAREERWWAKMLTWWAKIMTWQHCQLNSDDDVFVIRKEHLYYGQIFVKIAESINFKSII